VVTVEFVGIAIGIAILVFWGQWLLSLPGQIRGRFGRKD
jgi:hypothetical protein